MKLTSRWIRLWLVISVLCLLIVVIISAQNTPQLEDLDAADALPFISAEAQSLLTEKIDEINSIRYGPDWISIYYAADHNVSVAENDLLSSELKIAGAKALPHVRRQHWIYSLINYWIAPSVLLLTILVAISNWLKMKK